MAALDEITHRRSPDHDLLEDLSIARIINRLHGFPVIAAWQVGQLDDLWLDVFLGVATDLPKKQETQRLIDQKFREFRAEHPTYSKIRH